MKTTIKKEWPASLGDEIVIENNIIRFTLDNNMELTVINEGNYITVSKINRGGNFNENIIINPVCSNVIRIK